MSRKSNNETFLKYYKARTVQLMKIEKVITPIPFQYSTIHTETADVHKCCQILADDHEFVQILAEDHECCRSLADDHKCCQILAMSLEIEIFCNRQLLCIIKP